MTRPNVVYLFADQWRASAVGYRGDPNVKTPHINKLARESIDFTTAISNCPICTPYRASLMTGQYPLTTGIFMNDLSLAVNTETNYLAQIYANAGYDTAYIGKWHIDGHGRSSYIPRGRRLGFDYWKVLECTHDYCNSPYYENEFREMKAWDGYDAFAQTEDAVNYLENRSSAEPFLLMVSYGIPHNPYHTAPEELKDIYPEEKIVLPPNVSEDCESQARRDLQGYYAHITALDQCVGQIIDTLAQQGLDDNTILIVTSDHGDCVWSHCQADIGNINKQRSYEESIKIPFLLRYPEKLGRKHKEIMSPVATPDIMPTLLELSEIEIPQTVEGVSLTPVILNEEELEREGVLIASYAPFADWCPERGGKEFRGIRTEQYTYTRNLTGPWQLYDNEEDPYQLNNFIDDPDYQDLQDHLDILLQEILQDQDDEFLPAAKLCEKWGYHSFEHGFCIPLEKGKEWYEKAEKLRESQ